MANPEMLGITRKESGNYTGVGGIGITETGKVVLADDFSKLTSAINDETRIIENHPVDGAMSAPIKIYSDYTLLCPLKCPSCLAGVPTMDRKIPIPSLTGEQVKRINQQIIDAGVLQVKLGGGEPFTYKSFFESVEQLGEAKIGLSTSTSGVTLMDQKKLSNEQIKILAKYKVKISISVDGAPEYHDKIRGKKGLLEGTLVLGIERLVAGGVLPQKIEYRATINNSKESMEQLEYLDELSQRTGRVMRIKIARPYGSASINETGITKLNSDTSLLFSELRYRAGKNPLLNIDQFLRFDKTEDIKAGLDCGAGTRAAAVDAYGRFIPCGALDSYINDGDSILNGEATLLQSWQTGSAFLKVRKFFEDENKNSLCANCKFVNACQGGCPSVRLYEKVDQNPLCPKIL